MKLCEGMKKIREIEAVAHRKFLNNISKSLRPTRESLIAKIASILVESEETGIIKCRTESFQNCIFSEDW